MWDGSSLTKGKPNPLAFEDRSDDEDGGPAVEPRPRCERPCHDEARDDADQTQHGVEEGVRGDAQAEDHRGALREKGPNVRGVTRCASRGNYSVSRDNQPPQV